MLYIYILYIKLSALPMISPQYESRGHLKLEAKQTRNLNRGESGTMISHLYFIQLTK